MVARLRVIARRFTDCNQDAASKSVVSILGGGFLEQQASRRCRISLTVGGERLSLGRFVVPPSGGSSWYRVDWYTNFRLKAGLRTFFGLENQKQRHAHRFVVTSGILPSELRRRGGFHELCDCKARRRYGIKVFGKRVMVAQDTTPFGFYLTEAEPRSLDAPQRRT